MQQNERQKLIVRTSALGMVTNLLIAAVKIIAGMAASSLAIVSEGINNATDAASSALTMIGTKLSSKHPDEKHPFGYGRIEYLTSLVVAILILYTGITLLKESIEGIFHPSEMAVTPLAIILVAVSAAVKLFLGLYTIRIGKETGSDALSAVGVEGRNDSLFSIVTIAVSVVYLIWGLSLDAYAGVVFSLVIIRAGLEPLKETVSVLIGKRGEKELADNLYREIRSADCVISAADMMLHNYGPDAYSGSVNIEIDHDVSVGDVYASIHALQLRIMHEYKVTMVFGIYAVDTDNPDSKVLRRTIADFVRSQEYVKSYHAVYIDPKTDKIYCDLIVDYKLKSWDTLRDSFMTHMEKHYPGREIELTIETEFV